MVQSLRRLVVRRIAESLHELAPNIYLPEWFCMEAIDYLRELGKLNNDVLVQFSRFATDAKTVRRERCRLHTLQLSFCPNVTDAGITALLDHPIELLDVQGCRVDGSFLDFAR